ncbi:MAG: transglycosylase SLT domain-containing protein [Elusimicrobia bacterium]|nr:transglycosylase SLT domain-containing protein [Elusimicrobiota bacterium]
MRRRSWLVVSAAALVQGLGGAQEPAGSSSPVAGAVFSSTAPSSDTLGTPLPATNLEEKPSWLLRAEKNMADGVAAETAGDLRSAHRKYAKALKLIAEGADDVTLLSLRPQISELMGLAGQGAGPEIPIAAIPPPAVNDPVRVLDLSASLPRTSTHSYSFRINAEDPLVKRYVELYTGPLRGRTQEAFDRMSRYLEMVNRTIEEEQMPKELAYLPVVESEYQPFAVSPAGAVGLWQFMSSTAKFAGLKINYWIDERRDPDKSTRAAMKTLKSLYDWFDDWSLALAAYNRGLYGIQRDLEFTRSTNFSLLSSRQGVPVETEHYVPKLMALVLIGENPAAHGFRAPSSGRSPKPDTVILEKPLDLKVAAACARTTEAVIRELNPSLRLWVTPNNEPNFALKVPPGSKTLFLEELAKVKDWTPSPGFVRYTVQKGDILGRIAKRYRTTSEAIQRENKIANPNRLRPGDKLVIRPGRGFKGE